ncbi:thioredoxin family protein [Cochleicola gelatinilyticus]|uniref:Thioredoxin n=1 Tax=Cochleicola gelatinilyticus TaxID=1763537 RepID=A0A167HTL0_9FLAO|nr:thioredoxin family protein [Cochleicola gelatinilyticus]OAB78949.1 thioredoxin [Cochleicola gelatinilyticus]
MKRLLIIVFLFSGFLGFAQDELITLNWHTDLEEAEKISQAENKQILVYFTGSDWCSPCIALKKDFFETSEFADRADNFVLVMIDYPRRVDILSEDQLAYNKKIVAKYNKNKSFPKLVMLNAKGQELGKLSGYSSFNTYKDTSHHFAFVDKFSSSN